MKLLSWRPPKLPAGDGLERAERAYRLAWEAAHRQSANAVELAYHALTAASQAWRDRDRRAGPDRLTGTEDSRARALHDSSLNLLLRSAQLHGRWHGRRGIELHLSEGTVTIPVRYEGFVWTAADFQELELVGDYPSEGLNHVHRRFGVGVPLVAVRRRDGEERFFDAIQPFAATAVWQPGIEPPGEFEASGEVGPDARPPLGLGGTLEIVNPRQHDTVTIGQATYPLAADLSAPFAWALLREPRRFREGFLQPGQPGEQAKLFMLEPHRAGRIPVVFVHGLLSDPLTWVAAANDLSAQPWFDQRYEIWGYRYPTGEPFLRSAATLRRELQVLYDHLQSLQPDPQLDRMVLIGHSMGGLICKLQVTSSGDRLWRSAAYVDFDSIRAAPQQRAELARLFFFEPRPFVERTVFIGTPHGGSAWAGRIVGRIASSLVERTRQQVASHCQLIHDNPGAFAPYIRSRVPTSIDLLEPDNPLLQAIRRLPVSPQVRLHSVIGTGGRHHLGPPSDGVVPVESARHPGVVEELFVDERHEDLQRHPKTIHFLGDLLREHAAISSDASTRRVAH